MTCTLVHEGPGSAANKANGTLSSSELSHSEPLDPFPSIPTTASVNSEPNHGAHAEEP